MPPSAPDMSAIRRVLIIKMSALGDIIHALPVSAALGTAFPNIELTWAVEERFAPLVTGNPYLSHIITLPRLKGSQLRSGAFRRDYVAHLRDVRCRRFDLTLDLQGLTKSAVIAAASGARVRLGYHWLREAAGLVERPIPRRQESVHIVDQYLDVARFLGAKTEPVRFPFYIPPEEEAMVEALLMEHGIAPDRPFIAINPASALAIKQWDAAHYAALIDVLALEHGIPSVLVTTDTLVAGQVAAAAREPFANLCGRTNLKQLAAVLRRCAAHVCGDTGSGHLAAVFESPVISLIGPTDPDRVCPYGQRDSVISHREVCAVACTWHKCVHPRPHCLDAISVTEVAAEVLRRIAGHVGSSASVETI